MPQTRIESLLSARLFLAPELADNRIFFVSNLGGHMSLYAMDSGGSVPEPLLPPDLALQNPHLVNGRLFAVFPALCRILVMVDDNGDENYQPMLIPLDGGIPEPAFGGALEGTRVAMFDTDRDRNLVYLWVQSREEAMSTGYRGNLETGELVELGSSAWGSYPTGHTEDGSKVLLADGYTVGDSVVYLWDEGTGERRLVHGTPLEERGEDYDAPLTAIGGGSFVNDDQSLLALSTLYDDTGGLVLLDLDNPDAEPQPVKVTGQQHSGMGELYDIRELDGDRYAVEYNIDGVSWLYEGTFDADSREMSLGRVLVGEGELANGTLESYRYDKATGRIGLAFSTATTPTQIYTIEPDGTVTRHTRERILGIPAEWLSPGEDASYTSFDGTRISARLYRPAEALGFEGPRPLVYYVHGGPQSQERPDFAWFSIPLIQFLTLNGFAVFVPNVRGSTGYGLAYTKEVDRDWGGKDRLDHVHAMTEVLPGDPGVDTDRAGVVGRSYGGYMTLTLAARHPDLWKAAVDMFGPYDLLTFDERIPETWKPYFAIALGDPVKDRDFLIERSPRTHMDALSAPLLVIQGKNDPRVVEQESADLVERLREDGKEIDYLMFPDEGHDVLKFANRVMAYNAITDFFKKYLRP